MREGTKIASTTERPPGNPEESGRRNRGSWQRLKAEDIANRYGLVGAWIVLIAVFGALEPDKFLTLSNFQDIFSSQAVLVVLSIGVLPALAVGAIDLSIAGTMGLALVIVGWLNVLHGWPIALAVLVALAAGVIVGGINALVIVRLGIDSIVATLGMGTLLAGIAIGINNLAISGISTSLIDAARTNVGGLQLVFFYALALALVLWYVFRYTPLGRYLFFIGGGGGVARLSGIPVDRVRAGSLVFSGLASAFSGVLLAGVLGAADPTVGPSYLLPALAGAFLGATAIVPGRFNVWGTVIAVYFLATGITGLELLGLSGYIEQVFYGGSLVLAVVLSRLASRRTQS
ncbi:ABC transporter permease [Capillimicrobium parvum]|uniref:D-allose transport system permease protein AlsC n=1 Tax=Capillimicrobium parvum TaxID=2884022 RepID=A0A9E6XUA8_9ACTN|nr:ABC transporter permease [Capillimicrobium parvum]UGS33891.1 D-allose transport system permease protein AlsC [Capillimicrobium parvum]